MEYLISKPYHMVDHTHHMDYWALHIFLPYSASGIEGEYLIDIELDSTASGKVGQYSTTPLDNPNQEFELFDAAGPLSELEAHAAYDQIRNALNANHFTERELDLVKWYQARSPKFDFDSATMTLDYDFAR